MNEPWITQFSNSPVMDADMWDDTHFLNMIEMLLKHWQFPLGMKQLFPPRASALLSRSLLACAHVLSSRESRLILKC